MRSCFYIKNKNNTPTKQHRKMFVQNIYILGFIEPLLTIVQNWRQLQWPPVGEGTSKLWHSHPVDATSHQRSEQWPSRPGGWLSRTWSWKQEPGLSPTACFIRLHLRDVWIPAALVNGEMCPNGDCSWEVEQEAAFWQAGMLFTGIGCGLHRWFNLSQLFS